MIVPEALANTITSHHPAGPFIRFTVAAEPGATVIGAPLPFTVKEADAALCTVTVGPRGNAEPPFGKYRKV
jgi:hypothetical protein